MIENFWFKGDLHGRFEDFEQLPKEERQAVIVLGDVGINFYGGLEDYIAKKKLLSYGNYTVYCLRGNHDKNPRTIEPHPIAEIDPDIGGVVLRDADFDRIKCLIDGNIYKIKEYTLLPIGGAYSVDKDYRLARGWTWFDDEQIDERTKQLIIDNIQNHRDIDIIISHTCPASWEDKIKYLFSKQVDQSTIDKSTERFLDEVIHQIPDYKAYLFGHYHDDKQIGSKEFMLYHNFIKLNDILSLY